MTVIYLLLAKFTIPFDPQMTFFPKTEGHGEKNHFILHPKNWTQNTDRLGPSVPEVYGISKPDPVHKCLV